MRNCEEKKKSFKILVFKSREFLKIGKILCAFLIRVNPVIQSFNSLFFVRVFHAAIFVSPFISTTEAVINAQANFWPLAVSI